MKYTEDSPYGYWISKDDIIPVIGEEEHIESACDILMQKYGRLPKRIGIMYYVMFRLGYVRIINYKNTSDYGAEYWSKDTRLSKLQKQFVNSAANVDFYNFR